MKFAAKTFLLLALLGTMSSAQIQFPNPFKHVVVIFQENRTPDNLFQGLCAPPFGTNSSCSITPNASQYNIATKDWLDKRSHTGITQPKSVRLGDSYDLAHSHGAFISMCDAGVAGFCKMDGAAGVTCHGTCPSQPQYRFVDNSTGTLNPYLQLATQYGWGNYMFQTNQGPSFPAHQFIFGGTSAPSASDDAAGVFVAENPSGGSGALLHTGCPAPLRQWNWLISPLTAPDETRLVNEPLGMLCFSHSTLATLVDDSPGLSWRYYTPSAGSIWTAPNAIREICQPDSHYRMCKGSEWVNNVDLTKSDVLNDINACHLRSLSWVIPAGQNSDHPGTLQNTGGPSWVASIVNAIGNNTQCEAGHGYWSDTAILITWDDWGGWYDHEPPTILGGNEGDYQYGFRVPLIVVSAYTPVAYISNDREDFGSILRFIEGVFNLPGGEGALGFADSRSNDDLRLFFNFQQKLRTFQTITAPLNAGFFLHDTRPPEPPDND